MDYQKIISDLIDLMLEEIVLTNPDYYVSLDTALKIVRKDAEYRRQVAMLMGERWVERYMNEDRTNRC